MPWPLKFITLGTQCGVCLQVYPFVEDHSAAWSCPNGCVVTVGLSRRIVDAATGLPPLVGDAFYRPDMLRTPNAHALTQKYWTQHAKRSPICVVLPGPRWWVVDTYAYNQDQGQHGEGWDVTGDIEPGAPTLSCSPSINCPGLYHGYVTAGVITDDCEGRRFGPAGQSC